ncbi:hypothetical protein BGZ76_002500 [Entomortierella beljakovae]|nr:hypothetical protein BGZ76_002500 [Entomortierella beljakovae]
MAETTNKPQGPHVLIVGAGVSGLLHAIMLKTAGISFEIIERAPTVKPLGAIMSINANILPVFEQLGLLDDLMKVSFTSPGMTVYGENQKKIAFRGNDGIKEALGYDFIVFSRPDVYDLLLSQIDSTKIHFGKKLVSIEQTAEGVKATCADESTFNADIIVGADGAYSAVRQCIYKDLEEKKQLPASDSKAMEMGYITMVGTTDELDPEKYADLKDNFTHFKFYIGKGKPYTWSTFTVPGKKICWGVQIQLAATTSDDRASKNSEWGPEGNESMIKEIYDFPTLSGPLGDFIEKTPRERISKVFLEEKMFQTWYHGRVVLIGDAAHKILPSTGQGAVNGMQDAVILANCLYDIALDPTPENITSAFKDYKDQRFKHVKVHFDSSKMTARVIFGQTWTDRLLRKIVFGLIPESMLHKDTLMAGSYRPQCTFLPLAPAHGTEAPLPQKPSKRYQELAKVEAKATFSPLPNIEQSPSLNTHKRIIKMTNEAYRPTSPPRVIIVGAGIAGVFLGILLDRARIPYEIFERASTVKQLGAIMSVNVNILPVFEQLGLYDELMNISFTSPGMHIYNENMKKIAYRGNEGLKEAVGYDFLVFSRPQIYDLLLSKIPPGKIHYGKKVLSIKHPAEGGVVINCSDNTSYLGDILVGADGAYSAVRQSLYKQMTERGDLPHKDTQGLKIGYITMVGTTDPLDPERYEHLKDDFTHFSFIIGKGKPYSWSTFTIPGHRVCWSIQIQLTQASAEDKAFRNTEWGPESNESMIREVYNFNTPYGPIGQFIDQTPKDRISKVFLEEKMFETWHDGLTVLIGDAAHKMLPSAGQGAVNAMQDAVILANSLYDISDDPSRKNIKAAFKDFKEQRYPHVQNQFDISKVMAKVMFGQTVSERVLRQFIFGVLPNSILHKDTIKAAAYRPQLTFLPFTPYHGKCFVLPQKPSKRYLEEQKAKEARKEKEAIYQY